MGFGAVALTLAFFLVLPVLQTIKKPPATDLVVQNVDVAQLEPPPPMEEEEPEEEPEEQEPEPELDSDAPPLDLDQLNMALNASMGDGWGIAGAAVNINKVAGSAGNADALFSLAELDQKPRPIYQPSPMLDSKVRKRAPGKVYIIFVVDENGRVVNPTVQKSSHQVFEKPALAAVKQWKFEPGKRNGQAVKFRMRVPITFPKEQ
jgi:protein TonB